MSGPVFAISIGPERKRIDEDRLGADELNVIGARVRQGDTARQGGQMHVEM